MKHILRFILSAVILTAVISCSACGGKPAGGGHPGETPLGVQYRQEKGYLSYTNETYCFRIDYPDIFTGEEEAKDGIIFSSDACELRAWAKGNPSSLTIDEAYSSTMKGYSDVSGNVCGRGYFAFEFRDGKKHGYYYSMLVNDLFYTFRFIYPEEEKDTFETYCVDMATTFVVTGTYNKKK